MREADRQTDEKPEEEERQGKSKRQERQEKQKKRQESELCLAGTFKGYTCCIADGGKTPGHRSWRNLTALTAEAGCYHGRN